MKAHHVPLAIGLILVGTAVALVRAQQPAATDKSPSAECMMMQKAGTSTPATSGGQNGMAAMNHGAMAGMNHEGMNHQAMMQTADGKPMDCPMGKTMDCDMAAADQKGAKGAMGQGAMPGMKGMGGMDDAAGADMQVFHKLLSNGEKIQRNVTRLPNGIDTNTTSNDPNVVNLLKSHVASMLKRIEDGRAIHQRDPLFVEVFKNAKHIDVKVEPLANGVRVIETSTDAYTAKLLHEHADVVSLFIKNGMSEMHKNHAVPAR